MKKLFLLISIIGCSVMAFSQVDSTAPPVPKKANGKKDWSKVTLGNRANDHFMAQLGFDNWAGKPDTINTKGFAHSINVYFMLDFPFKTDPRFSIGLGAGVSGS